MEEGKEIQILDKDTINKIAAGEVIERPASVVKELVDNSIDAGAKNIRIELEDSGKKLIVVKDDGKGMSREDVILCPLKHATSKIRNADDLESVRTMGFRGEALSSISSVSKFEIVTKRREDPIGSHLVTEEGKPPKIFDVGTTDGTSVYVRDLFCTVPVRRKYLKSDATELAHVVKIVGELILSNESLTITLTNNGKKILASPGSNLKNSISDVMGPETARLMISISREPENRNESGTVSGKESETALRKESDAESEIKINGFISKPEFNRGTPEFITFIINGRPVSSKELMKAVRLGYYTKIPNTRYPAAIIKIDMPSELVDVNVHPRKTEVRFADEKRIQNMLTERIEEALRRSNLATTLTAEKTGKIIDKPFSEFGRTNGATQKNEDVSKDERIQKNKDASKDEGILKSGNEAKIKEIQKNEDASKDEGILKSGNEAKIKEIRKNEDASKDEGIPKSRNATGIENIQKNENEAENKESQKNEILTKPENLKEEPGKTEEINKTEAPEKKKDGAFPIRDNREKYEGRYTAPVVDTDKRLTRSARLLGDCEEKVVEKIEDIRIVGQISDLYILAETGTNDLVIIDQHAAHERIFYDLFRNMDQKQTQELIDPIVLHLSPREKVLVKEYIPILEETGFGVSEFGENDFIVSFVPLVFGKLCGSEVIKDLITDIFETGKPKTANDAKDLILKRMSCRAAIKSGASCTEKQMLDLVRQLRKTEHPYSCPHGRPVIVTLSLKEIAKLFERL